MKSENELQKELRDILIDIIINNEDRYDDLFNHKYIKKKINGVAKRFYNNTGFCKQEIKGIARIIVYKELKNDKFKVDDQKNVERDFLARLNSMLYQRVNNYNDELRIREKGVEGKETSNLGAINVPIELLDDSLIKEDFADKVATKIDLENFVENNLSNRETQVFHLIFREDMEQHKVAEKLGVIQETVYVYKERILRKFKDYVNISRGK